KDFVAIQDETEALLRRLLGIPADYEVLLLQGGAHLQFAMVPINLMGAGTQADYIVNGVWSEKAAEEARRFGQVRVAGSIDDGAAPGAPRQGELDLDEASSYVHYCSNETVNGIEFPYVPETGRVPLVADMSSHFLSRPVDVSRFGLIYAGAQKNFGPAGLTVVIVRKDLLGMCGKHWPTMLDYAVHAKAGSAYNTPPTYSIYIANLVLKWLERQGGVEGIEQRNIEKSALLYDAIDASGGFYANVVERDCRSRMNVPFFLKDSALDAEFLAGADQRGLVQLKGHRIVGGMRASIYNAMPVDGVRALVSYMQEFARTHG
ncbi:MAG: 3-phosphoserine/phosphohydroxythreonine transaminase, partial [Burkholderiaceae bacterium]